MLTGSLVALVTPMFEDGQVDFESLKRLVDFHIDNGTDGIVAVGTTGESATLGVDEHIKVVAAVAQHAAGRITVIAGTGGNSTSEAIELAALAKQAFKEGKTVRQLAYEIVVGTKDNAGKTITREAIDEYLDPWSMTLPGGEGSAGG